MKTRIMLFEDHLLGDMSPIALTRPAFAVTCACSTLYDIAVEAGGDIGWIVRDFLRQTVSQHYRGIPYDPSGPWLFLNASLLPDVRYAGHIRDLIEAGRPSQRREAASPRRSFRPAPRLPIPFPPIRSPRGSWS